ncbi:uncharacterized protein METZ01_LOCUS234446 [marine metagenome]|uniref:Uncharacterized protein n=1 Tax=marine metagenome TaxID=408172 RepID=A0A382H347_9ZZZZ
MSDKDQTKIDYQIFGLGKPKLNLFFIWFIKPFSLFPSWYFHTTRQCGFGSRQLAGAWPLSLSFFGGGSDRVICRVQTCVG